MLAELGLASEPTLPKDAHRTRHGDSFEYMGVHLMPPNEAFSFRCYFQPNRLKSIPCVLS